MSNSHNSSKNMYDIETTMRRRGRSCGEEVKLNAMINIHASNNIIMSSSRATITSNRKRKAFQSHRTASRSFIILSILFLTQPYHWLVVQAQQSWTTQVLRTPYGGEVTGTTTYDLNGDGYMDLLFAAGRHSVDQSYALINLGYRSDGTFQFSNPIPLGDPGGYYQIDASPLSSLPAGHVAVFLAGGTCGDDLVCERGTNQPATLLNVRISGCSVENPYTQCQRSVETIWQDANPAGDRNGAFAPTLGNGVDPAIVLAGKGGITVFEPTATGEYTNPATFTLLPDGPELQGENITISRTAALAVGFVGDMPGLVAGVRTEAPPAPLLAVYKTPDGDYRWFDFGNSGDAYAGNPSVPVEPTGVKLGDLNGDGVMDIIESNFVRTSMLTEGYPVEQYYYLLDSDPNNDVMIPPVELFDSDIPGRTLDVGQIFEDSNLPDIVHAMIDGSVRTFANLGVSAATNEFLGFEERDTFSIDPNCQIRDIAIASLAPCTVSLIGAVSCFDDSNGGGNYIFNAAQACANTGNGSTEFDSGGNTEFETGPTVAPSAAGTRFIASDWPTAYFTIASDWPTTEYSNWPSAFPTASATPTSNPTTSTQPSGPTNTPSFVPSEFPSMYPTAVPSEQPSSPTTPPSDQPSTIPSMLPTGTPSGLPSEQPSLLPTGTAIPTLSEPPSLTPTFSTQPSGVPSALPSIPPKLSTSPSLQPSETTAPSNSPSATPSTSPSASPTFLPTTPPSNAPTPSPSSSPSSTPSASPTSLPTPLPTPYQSDYPTITPLPSPSPSGQPSLIPSGIPSSPPSRMPSYIPSDAPSNIPSPLPSRFPSPIPSSLPSATASALPSDVPSMVPSPSPSVAPSFMPTTTRNPTPTPSSVPSTFPSESPSHYPSGVPSDVPSNIPSPSPSASPTRLPTISPSGVPSRMPSDQPSMLPSTWTPSTSPSIVPTMYPSPSPSGVPTEHPTISPSAFPSGSPSFMPSPQPSITNPPSTQPSDLPSMIPSWVPTGNPTRTPSSVPSFLPSSMPSDAPSIVPSLGPSPMPSTSAGPTSTPSTQPVAGLPTSSPTLRPTRLPISFPSETPSQPVAMPISFPSETPSQPVATSSNNPTSSVPPESPPSNTNPSDSIIDKEEDDPATQLGPTNAPTRPAPPTTGEDNPVEQPRDGSGQVQQQSSSNDGGFKLWHLVLLFLGAALLGFGVVVAWNLSVHGHWHYRRSNRLQDLVNREREDSIISLYLDNPDERHICS